MAIRLALHQRGAGRTVPPMPNAMLQFVERVSAGAVRHVEPVHPARADGIVAEVYAQLRREFLVAPPFTLHSPVPDILGGVWSVCRETLVAGEVPRALKEAVATAVSQSNACPFCVDAHLTALQASGSTRAVQALERGDPARLDDPMLRGVIEWAATTRNPGAPILARPPFNAAEAPEIIGTALAFHYMNRMVNVFCADSPLPLPSALSGLRGMIRRLSAPMMRAMVSGSHPRGDSLVFVPKAGVPADLAWAASCKEIAAAWAGAAAILDRHVATAIGDAARRTVEARIAAWQGEDPGLGRAWLDGTVTALEGAARAEARLALLAALASHRVDDAAIADYRRHHAGDAPLVALTAWASFAAARRIGTWLHVPDAAPRYDSPHGRAISLT